MSRKDDKPLFAFFGTPKFAVDVLSALEAHGYLPALIVTAPDKPRGRGLELLPSPAKQWAMERGIATIEPATLKEIPDELLNTDWDLFVVAAYAKLLRKNVLDLPRRGCLNVHPSLLPKFRGPSPAVSNILANERETGVSIMQMDEGMDTGPVVAQARVEIAPEDWPIQGSVLEELLATEGGNLLAETIPDWIAGSISPAPQDEARASHTKKFSDEDALVDIHGDPMQALIKIRAFDKNPRAHAFGKTVAGKDIRVIITEAHVEDDKLVIDRVLPEGKKEMSYQEFLHSGATL